MTQYLLSVYMIDGQEPPSEAEITNACTRTSTR